MISDDNLRYFLLFQHKNLCCGCSLENLGTLRYIQNFQTLASFCYSADSFESSLVKNGEDCFFYILHFLSITEVGDVNIYKRLWNSATRYKIGGSGGIMSTARPELPYPCVSQAKSRDETSRRGKSCDGAEHGYK